MFAEEILSQIDATIDQLIRNVEAVKRVDLSDLSDSEIDAFQKTQESLLHHLITLDESLETKRKSLRQQNTKSATYKIQEKLARFEKIKDEVSNTIAKSSRKSSVFTKRRTKRLLCQN